LLDSVERFSLIIILAHHTVASKITIEVQRLVTPICVELSVSHQTGGEIRSACQFSNNKRLDQLIWKVS